MTTERTVLSKEKLSQRMTGKYRIDACGCWIWVGAINSRGYGQIWNGVKTIQAHRASYEVHKGEAIGKLVCHKCDVKSCVNPDHLFLGSDGDNLNDCYAKGRRGIVLSKDKLSSIRSMVCAGVPYWKIGLAFGIGKNIVYRLKKKDFKPSYANAL